MECINFLWGWVGDNSGQLQILIAVGALFYAWMAYQKVLEQIKISNRLERESEKNRFYELKLNLIKAVDQKSRETLALHEDFLRTVDMYFYCKQSFIIKSDELNEDLDLFFKEVLNDKGLNHLELLKNRTDFLDATFHQINNPELMSEHIEKILSKIFESDLAIDEIENNLHQMKHLIEAMKNIGQK